LNCTFMGWGGYGKKTRTRDRGKERVAERIKLESVVRVQNAESFVMYQKRKRVIKEALKKRNDLAFGDVWDIKTNKEKATFTGAAELDPTINEVYLFHGTSPAGAEGITDNDFDMKRVGSAYGSLFGGGIYFAESCMKADEYVVADHRGLFPVIMCRVVLGSINYCDAKEPSKIARQLEESCTKNRDRYHSVLGDRQKVMKTFREFIIFDNHQVLPEFICWYRRIYS